MKKSRLRYHQESASRLIYKMLSSANIFKDEAICRDIRNACKEAAIVVTERVLRASETNEAKCTFSKNTMAKCPHCDATLYISSTYQSE